MPRLKRPRRAALIDTQAGGLWDPFNLPFEPVRRAGGTLGAPDLRGRVKRAEGKDRYPWDGGSVKRHSENPLNNTETVPVHCDPCASVSRVSRVITFTHTHLHVCVPAPPVYR